MERVKIALLVVLMAVMASTVQSAPTTYTDVYNFGNEGLIWDSANHTWAEWVFGSDPTVEWVHNLPADMDMSSLVSASLTITGSGIENCFGDMDLDGFAERMDSVQVYWGSDLLGDLSGNTTTFAIAPGALEQHNMCQATIRFVWDHGTIDDILPIDTVRLCSSALTVALSPVAVVPVPGAVVLAGVGVVLVVLRRRNRR